MKKTGILNYNISKLVASMGHTDWLTIADCGLPMGDESKRIDIALKRGEPSFINTLKIVLTELKVEKAYIAKETKETNPENYKQIHEILKGIEIVEVPHSELKEMDSKSKGIIRTGECTPFSNIILQSGVAFD